MMNDDSGASLVGRAIGGYQVLSRLGAGGMGEVYRARDLKLGRDVAIKVLPSFFAADPERLRRFEREARLLASLNHSHIGAIYGFEQTDGISALVLELIDGPTLADRIASGPVPTKEALKIGHQIAEALEAAHEKGIIHRDLKPANIKLTRDGDVKVLDFGLAKAFAGVDSSPDISTMPTVTATDLRPGAIVGTPAYMSPEQARGQAIDKRTDIWAFGCVLYEMLTGRVAFPGDTISDTIAAILEREPAWTALPASTPAAVRRLLEQCLEKDPRRRLRDIGQARIELDDAIAEPPARDTRSAPPVPTPLSRRLSAAVGLGLLLLAGGVGVFYSVNRSVPVTSPSEYTQITNFTDSATAPSLSPDGRMVTFIRGGESFLSRGQIYVKLLPNGESVQLTNNPDNKYGPVFTPDGSRIAYSQVTRSGASQSWDTWTVPVLGGQPTMLLPNASGLTWMTNQRVLFSEIKSGLHMGLVTATEGRADSREIYFPPHQLQMAHYSYPSPDRKSILVVEMGRTHAFDLPCRLLPLDGSSPGRPVGPPGRCLSAAWSPDGTWMYFGAEVGGNMHLWRQKFPDGTPEQITFGPTQEEGIAVAPDGRSLITSVGRRQSAIWIHDAAGERPISSEGYASDPRLSRDGKRVFYLLQRGAVVPSSGPAGELRSVDLASGKTDSVLPGLSVTDYDISLDGREVAFTTTASGGESQIWLAVLDRRSPPRLIVRSGDQVSFGANEELVFRLKEVKENFLYRISKDGTGPQRITTTPFLEKFGVSPDGEWVTAVVPRAREESSESIEVPIETVAVPVHGGGVGKRVCGRWCAAFWSSDGRFLHVVLNGSTVHAVDTPALKGMTLAVPVPAGSMLPDLPVSGLSSPLEAAPPPGTRVIREGHLSPGPDPSTHVFQRTELRGNLFRIPLH